MTSINDVVVTVYNVVSNVLKHIPQTRRERRISVYAPFPYDFLQLFCQTSVKLLSNFCQTLPTLPTLPNKFFEPVINPSPM
jgi:hypothetical protein